MVTAQDLFDAYLNALAEGGQAACADYNARDAWTCRASLALVKVGRVAFPESEAASKPHHDKFGRAEYLALDVMLYKVGWKPPLFIAEHENVADEDRIGYAAWKLLVVEAGRRMLVAYFGTKGVESFDRLKEIVNEVCVENPGKDILLVGADCNAKPLAVGDLRAIHKTAIVGVPLAGNR